MKRIDLPRRSVQENLYGIMPRTVLSTPGDSDQRLVFVIVPGPWLVSPGGTGFSSFSFEAADLGANTQEEMRVAETRRRDTSLEFGESKSKEQWHYFSPQVGENWKKVGNVQMLASWGGSGHSSRLAWGSVNCHSLWGKVFRLYLLTIKIRIY